MNTSPTILGKGPGPARVGIGGPVGSGKTAVIEQLLPRLRDRGIITAVVTNDLVTREDAERLKRSGLIDPEKVMAVETGACPHTVIREDPTLNMMAAEELERRYEDLDMILIESGGDNLASTFSLDLVDYWLFVIDVAGGDDIPRKRDLGSFSPICSSSTRSTWLPMWVRIWVSCAGRAWKCGRAGGC